MKHLIPSLMLMGSLAASLPAWSAEPIIAGSQPPPAEVLARGEYLARVAGCHDCHTPGYAERGGQAPAEDWLTGDDTAWAGPWGTSFATNLRISMRRFNDEQWIAYVRTLATRPPMPWFNLRSMDDEDLLALLHWVQWLGPKGEPSPIALPPGDTWLGPTVQFVEVAAPDEPLRPMRLSPRP